MEYITVRKPAESKRCQAVSGQVRTAQNPAMRERTGESGMGRRCLHATLGMPLRRGMPCPSDATIAGPDGHPVPPSARLRSPLAHWCRTCRRLVSRLGRSDSAGTLRFGLRSPGYRIPGLFMSLFSSTLALMCAVIFTPPLSSATAAPAAHQGRRSTSAGSPWINRGVPNTGIEFGLRSLRSQY
jgi:hypothetical protein